VLSSTLSYSIKLTYPFSFRFVIREKDVRSFSVLSQMTYLVLIICVSESESMGLCLIILAGDLTPMCSRRFSTELDRMIAALDGEVVIGIVDH